MADSRPNDQVHSRFKRLRSKLWRVAKGLIFLLLLFAFINIVGLVPVNNDFQPAADGIEIFIVSNPVHADIVMPISNATIDWRTRFPANGFSNNASGATHVAIGWGDKGFFLNTPTWSDLKLSTAATALLWRSPTCTHVSMLRKAQFASEARSVMLNSAQYSRLVQYVEATFRLDDEGNCIQVPDSAYGNNDAFFEAHGNYHCLNTCNSWVGGALKSAGVRTAWLTIMPKTVFLYLPN